MVCGRMEGGKIGVADIGLFVFQRILFSQIGFIVFSCMGSDGMRNMEGGIISHET